VQTRLHPALQRPGDWRIRLQLCSAKVAVVELPLSPEVEAGALRVAAFLMSY
jgi:hypothetical protein